MFECDAKLSADGVPFLLHDATLERTSNGHGMRRGAVLGRARAARRRQLAFAPLRRRAARQPRGPGALVPRQPATRSTSRSSRRRASSAAPARWSRSAPRGSGPTPRGAAPPELVRAGIAAWRPRPRGPRCRVACCSTSCPKAGSRPRAGSAARAVVCDHALWDAATVARACRRHARAELHRQRRVGRATPDRPGHRRHHHGPGRPLQPRGLSPPRVDEGATAFYDQAMSWIHRLAVLVLAAVSR